MGLRLGFRLGLKFVLGGQGWAWAYFSGRVGGWVGGVSGLLEIWRVRLISTQVVVGVRVGVELDKNN